MALKLLVGGDRLFDHPAVLRFYDRVMRVWQSDKPVGLLLGCSAAKPYSRSFLHAKVIAALKKHDLDGHVQQYIVGEPLVLCPREWETRYPASHYDFPPTKLRQHGRSEFVARLTLALSRIGSMHTSLVVFAPNHHRAIVEESWTDGGKLRAVPYNVYYLPRLVRALQRVSNGRV